MNMNDLSHFIRQQWDEDILPRLVDYIKIPAKSPAFDASWAEHGHLAAVIALARDWAQALPGKLGGQSTSTGKLGGQTALAGLKLEVLNIEGKTPCIFFDLPATQGLGSDQTIMFYGHLDKQPEMVGWREGLGPWIPVIEDNKLYGRGGADDGYALFAALTAIAAVDLQGAARPRCVGLIESCEESGSFDLPAYLELVKPRLGDVRLVIGLDSGCGNYDQLWVTTSLRGLIGGVLSVEILDEGVHSGMASGIVPSTFRIARKLLSRIDDVDTGHVLDNAFHAQIPEERLKQIRATSEILGDSVWDAFPWVGCSHEPIGPGGKAGAAIHTASTAGLHAQPTTTDPYEAILNRTWRPALSVTGAAGLPMPDAAGNVLRPRTALKLSMRLPPTVDGEKASAQLKKLLEENPPYKARVTFQSDWAATGWNAPGQRPVADPHAGRHVAKALWQRRGLHGRRRHHSVHEHAGRNLPQGAIPDHRCARTEIQRPRPNEFLHIPYVKKTDRSCGQRGGRHGGSDHGLRHDARGALSFRPSRLILRISVFKNLVIFRLSPDWSLTPALAETKLEPMRFVECSPSQDKAIGWAPPRGHAEGPLLESVHRPVDAQADDRSEGRAGFGGAPPGGMRQRGPYRRNGGPQARPQGNEGLARRNTHQPAATSVQQTRRDLGVD